MAALLPFLTVALEPAAASGSIVASGGIVFSGTAFLDRFPCTSGCGGGFSGSWQGELSGSYNDAAYAVSWKTVAAKVTATFSYLELLCAAPGSGAVAGEATGSVHAEATFSAAEVVGTWYAPNVNELPRLITDVVLDAVFEWVRVGNSAVIVLRPTSLHVNVAGLGWRNVVSGTQRGAATFVPTHSDQPTGIVSCDAPLTGVEGEISGSVPLHMPAL